jgi:hypothetical protein
MVEGSSFRRLTELQAMLRLYPSLLELCAKLPPLQASRISLLVGQAQRLPNRVRPDRLFKFAFLYATAERFVQDEAAARAVSKEHTRRSKLELAGEIHGLETGYRDDVEARRRYRLGRRARQQFNSSLDSLMGAWRAFEGVVEKHRSALPLHVQSRFSNVILGDIGKAFQNMGISIAIDEVDLAGDEGRERQRSDISLAYIWWCLKVAPYPGKWADMHQLALAWHMSPAATVRDFRATVYRVCKGNSCTHRFEKPWESALSGKV